MANSTMRLACPWLQNGIDQYIEWHRKRYGITDNATRGHYVKVDTQRARAIAAAYEALPTWDNSELTTQCFEQLATEIYAQYNFCTCWLGLRFEAWTQEGQPYSNSREMQADVMDNKHLYFFTGYDTLPPLGGKANELLRCIHDVFGHAAEGYQFGARGEENAWVHHSMMFSPMAQRALTTETRGQNSWVNYGPYSSLPVTERPYAEQKKALLPIDLCDWKTVLSEQ